MLHHVFNEYPISFRAVLDEYVGDRPDQLSVLDDRAAAHSLDDAASESQKLFVHHLDDHALALMGAVVIHLLDLDPVILHFSGNAAADKRLSLVDILAISL